MLFPSVDRSHRVFQCQRQEVDRCVYVRWSLVQLVLAGQCVNVSLRESTYGYLDSREKALVGLCVALWLILQICGSSTVQVVCEWHDGGYLVS